MIWLFKLTMTPLLVAVASLLIWRFGAAAGGLATGLPLMTGPIVVFIALEQGIDFAVASVSGVYCAIAGTGPFALAYAAASRRGGGWLACLVAGLAAYAAAVTALSLTGWGFAGLAAIATVLMLASLALMPRPSPLAGRGALPWWEIWLRMGVTAAIVVAITAFAEALGPLLGGILGTLPVISTVVASFTFRRFGAEAALAGLRSQLLAMLSFIAFFVVVATELAELGIALTFLRATAAALATSVLLYVADQGAARDWRDRASVVGG